MKKFLLFLITFGVFVPTSYAQTYKSGNPRIDEMRLQAEIANKSRLLKSRGLAPGIVQQQLESEFSQDVVTPGVRIPFNPDANSQTEENTNNNDLPPLPEGEEEETQPISPNSSAPYYSQPYYSQPYYSQPYYSYPSSYYYYYNTPSYSYPYGYYPYSYYNYYPHRTSIYYPYGNMNYQHHQHHHYQHHQHFPHQGFHHGYGPSHFGGQHFGGMPSHHFGGGGHHGGGHHGGHHR